MILADLSSFIGSVWAVGLFFAIGVGVGVWLVKSGKIK